MNIFQFWKFLWDHRKGAEYARRTGKVPLCECKTYLKTGDCEHMEESREYFRKLIKGE